MHEVYAGIGSNLGDRQANILAALQRLRARCAVTAVSAFYASPPAGGATGPEYLNLAVALQTALDRDAFEAFARDVEASVGRANAPVRLAPRPIDIDVLAIDGEIVREALEERAYDAAPLAEIAPHLVRRRDFGEVRKIERSLHFAVDRQSLAPDIALSLERAGVRSVRRTILAGASAGARVYDAEFTMSNALDPNRAGAHMSRYSEILSETLDAALREQAAGAIQRLPGAIARRIVESQHATHAEVRLRASFSLERWTPVSARPTQERYTLLAIAYAGPAGVRTLIGAEAFGMTACPCAQEMMRERSERSLRDAGFNAEDATRALDALPQATHNQRSRGSLLLGHLGDPSAFAVEDAIELIENAMSSETYELLKRPDELFVVNKAHARPRFVEDAARAMLAGALDMYADLGDDAFASVRQVNDESIHKHDAFAHGFGTFGELRAELRGQAPSQHTRPSRWLRGG
ncbi:MAG TPA: GTP cyclohydrolase MptA [Candidatus Tumulicola sp.]